MNQTPQTPFSSSQTGRWLSTLMILFNRKSSQQDTATRHLFFLSHEHSSMGEITWYVQWDYKTTPPAAPQYSRRTEGSWSSRWKTWERTSKDITVHNSTLCVLVLSSSDAWSKEIGRAKTFPSMAHGECTGTKVYRPGSHLGLGALPLQTIAKGKETLQRQDKRLLYIAMASAGSDVCRNQCKTIEKVWIKFELNHFPKWAQLFVMGRHPIGHTFRQA